MDSSRNLEKIAELAEELEDQRYHASQSNVMVDMLSHIVEFRNGESGAHAHNVRRITYMLLTEAVRISPEIGFSERKIESISLASVMHDIGKIAISDEILNKTGRLTGEEFSVMKDHAMIGARMIKDLPFAREEPLITYAYEICRWHHERYDGKGYPDGLVGDETPLSAQAVALADVYDALTRDRVYKRAFSHEEAVRMILGGECGAFNPLLLECLKNIEARIPEKNS